MFLAEPVTAALTDLVTDHDPHVRLQLACTLGASDTPAAGRALGLLAGTVRGEPVYLRAAIMSSAVDHLPALVDALLEGDGEAEGTGTFWLADLLGTALGTGDRAATGRILRSLAAPPAPGYARAQFNAELKRFTDRFGPDGATWFADGKTYEQALELFAQTQTKEIEAKDKENKELSDRLGSIDRGEEEPAELSDPSESSSDRRTTQFQQNLGTGLGRFAAGIKLPQSSRN